MAAIMTNEERKMVIAMGLSMRVSTNKDKTEAYLNMSTPLIRSEAPTERSIRACLSQNGIVFGLDSQAIKEIVEKPFYEEDLLVAKGVQPQNGKDGYIVHYFEQDPEKKPAVREDGTVDYKNMNIVHAVKKGGLICEIFPPEPGVEGSDVFGNKLRALNGKPAGVPRGKGIAILDDKKSVVSKIDGQVKRSGLNFEVKALFEVEKDVDNSTGNIRFTGNVIVRGNVTTGFSIEAGGSVEVFGRVEKANITAVGDITLHGGMAGMGFGTLKSGGNIFVKYVENCILSAHGNITAECIMHSKVRSGGIIELKGRKGLLVGGNVKASKMITAVTIGSHYATETEIEVGNDPKSKDRLKAIIDESQICDTEIKKSKQAIDLLEKMEAAGTLTSEKRDVYKRTKGIYEEYMEKSEELKKEQEELEAKMEKGLKGIVKASNFIYNGVKVTIGSASLTVKEELAHCSLILDGAEIKISAY
jgi:uncharacterized protein (DUF342 family)